VFLALDVLGTALVVLGILGLTGTNFGKQVLTTLAPGFIVLGVLLMGPLVFWAVRSARGTGS
jgi:hypothetical protein